MTKGDKSGSNAWLFALYLTNSAFPGVKTYEYGLAELTKLASLVETQLRDQLVHCGTLLGAYEALSYTWGSQTLCQKVQIRGRGLVRITASLYSALQHLRHPSCVRRLWADAICIDQSNPRERGHQVAMMSEIYRYAVRVLAWLGESESSDVLAFAAMSSRQILTGFPMAGAVRIDQRSRYGAHPSPTIAAETALAKHPYCVCCGTHFDRSHANGAATMTDAMLSLGHSAYFERLWVVQELAVAVYVEIYRGHHHTGWQNFTKWLLLVRSEASQRCRRAIGGVQRSKKTLGLRYSPNRLLGLLISLSQRKCDDARDRLFAVGALAELAGSTILARLDYSTSVVDIFASIVLECLNYRGIQAYDESDDSPHVAAVLALVGCQEYQRDHVVPSRYRRWEARQPDNGSSFKEVLHLPSWVPDFHRLRPTAYLKLRDYISTLRVAAASSNKAAQSWRPVATRDSQNPLKISIATARFGCIEQVSPVFDTPPTHLLNEVESQHLEARWTAFKDFTVEFLVAHLGHKLDFELKTENYINEQLELRRVEGLYDEILAVFRPDGAFSDAFEQPYWSFKVPGLHFAWVPRATASGDVLRLVGNAPRPFVFRQSADETHELLGDARVFGFEASELAMADASTQRSEQWIDVV